MPFRLATIFLLAMLAGCSGLLEPFAAVSKPAIAPIATMPGVAPRPKPTLPKLPIVNHPEVSRHLKQFLTTNRGHMEQSITRIRQYYPEVSEPFIRFGVPLDLLALGAVESKFNPSAKNASGATGIWQFMPRTAKAYGLKVGWLHDDRKDPALSSEAAAHHLLDLYLAYGDWYLALAAYNRGKSAVDRLLKQNPGADYWILRQRNLLPRETDNFVPRVIAAAIILREPKLYGFPEIVPSQVESR